MTNIHDSGYKKLFSNKTIFRQLLETFVKEDWVREIDFSDCQTIDKSFISEHYKETESDLIYKVKLKNNEVFIYILMEFQSTVDKFISLRILNYLTNFYMDYLINNKKTKKLPAIFPLMIYNGSDKWTSPINISELIDNNEFLGKYSLNFEYFKIIENEYGKEALLKIRNIVSTLFLAESNYDIDLLQAELISLFEREDDKKAISILLNWFKQLSINDRIDIEDYDLLEKVYRDKEEVKEMLISSIKKEKEKIRFEGKLAEKVEIVKRMFEKGYKIEDISNITQLSEKDVEKIINPDNEEKFGPASKGPGT